MGGRQERQQQQMDNVPWSYSSLSLFKLCPKKYFHERVAKDIPFEETDALRYGNAVHEAIETYLKGGELDDKYGQFRDIIDCIYDQDVSSPNVENLFVEHKVAYTRELKPCDFFAKEVWYRGKIDVLIVDGEDAWIIDWKTGRNAQYADMAELELFSIATFLEFPKVAHIKTAFIYLVSEHFIEKKFTREDLSNLLMKHVPEVDRLERAHVLNVWNPSPNFTCRRFCRVKSCQHYQK